jgi:hypothetical protein
MDQYWQIAEEPAWSTAWHSASPYSTSKQIPFDFGDERFVVQQHLPKRHPEPRLQVSLNWAETAVFDSDDESIISPDDSDSLSTVSSLAEHPFSSSLTYPRIRIPHTSSCLFHPLLAEHPFLAQQFSASALSCTASSVSLGRTQKGKLLGKPTHPLIPEPPSCNEVPLDFRTAAQWWNSMTSSPECLVKASMQLLVFRSKCDSNGGDQNSTDQDSAKACRSGLRDPKLKTSEIYLRQPVRSQPRLNGDYLRIHVIEAQMRRMGKLSESSKARVCLAPRAHRTVMRPSRCQICM